MIGQIDVFCQDIFCEEVSKLANQVTALAQYTGMTITFYFCCLLR